MKKNRRRRFVGPVIIILIILALAGFAGYNFFQVKHVEIEGNSQYGSDYIEALANIEIETHMLKVDEKKIKENVESNPYLELVEVDYKLPDTVVLTVNERQPICLMDYAGNTLLLDRQLIVLSTDGGAAAGSYPALQGIAVDAVNLGKQLGASDTFKISVATSILDELKSAEIMNMVTSIDLTDVNVITMNTAGGPSVLFGQSDMVPEKVVWIKKILPSLISEGKTAGTLDVSAGTFATFRLPEGVQNTGDTQGTEENGQQENNGSENLQSADPQTEDTQAEETQTGEGTQNPGTVSPDPGSSE